ncbi:MAG: hypothetical protein JXM70_03060 [Pirellulales bacterium]|nr:hypothetical protein [Pirellulales bacterium]
MTRYDTGKKAWLLGISCCLVLGLVMVCLFGCGSSDLPVYAVNGRVTFPDGAPVGAGWVEFRPIEAPRPVVSRGEIQADGTFELSTFKPNDGAIKGRHRAIVKPKMLFLKKERTEVPAVAIDPRFGSYETSNLEFTVNDNPAENEFLLVVEPPLAGKKRI